MSHLVEVPLRAWPGTKPTEVAGESWPELQNPAPDCFIGDVEPALGQELLHVAVAQGEPEIEPDRVPDDLRTARDDRDLRPEHEAKRFGQFLARKDWTCGACRALLWPSPGRLGR